MVFVVAIVDWLPAICNRLFYSTDSSGACGKIYKSLISLLLMVALIWHFNASGKNFAGRSERVGRSCDAFLAKPWPKGHAVSQTLQTIAEMLTCKI